MRERGEEGGERTNSYKHFEVKSSGNVADIQLLKYIYHSYSGAAEGNRL